MTLAFDEGLIANTVRFIHEAPHKIVLAATGGGLGLAQALCNEPGASATLLDAQLPYGRTALTDLIGHEPEQFCSQSTANWMASAAYARAREICIRDGEPHAPVLGVAVTASIATGRPKRGAHRAFFAVRDRVGMHVAQVVFENGRLTRREESRLCELVALGMIDNRVIAAIDDDLTVPYSVPKLIPAGSGISSHEVHSAHIYDPTAAGGFIVAPKLVPRLADGVVEPFGLQFLPGGGTSPAAELRPETHIIFPGSFNPLQFGHEAVARQAERMTGKTVVFEMTARHPDKGDVTNELLQRLEQFRWRWPVTLTRDASLYVDKARQFPGIGILIGVDAVKGLLNRKYYASPEAYVGALRNFSQLGTRFYVAGRLDRETGAFETLRDVTLPSGFEHLFLEVNGRWDVASRDIR